MAAIALAVALWAPPASACPVPVFRYALENWEPTVLDVVVVHRGPLASLEKPLVEAMTANGVADGGSANIAVRQVDVSAPINEVDRQLVAALGDASLPQVALCYHRRDGSICKPAWSGPLAAENVRTLLDSPIRRQIVSRIFKGDSVVWVVVDGGNKARDDKAAAVVSAAITQINAAFVQPVSAPDVPGGAGLESRAGGPPLRLALSMVRLSAADPAERVFAAMLRRTPDALSDTSQPDEVKSNEPLVVPIFGRGRTLGVIRETDLNGDAIQGVSEFLCGECSCQAKEQAGGLDLLIAADWDSAFSGEQVKDAPPLRGLGAFLGQGQPELILGGPGRYEPRLGASQSQTQPASANFVFNGGLSKGQEADSLWRNIIIAIAGLAVVGVGLPFIVVLIRRRLNKSRV